MGSAAEAAAVKAYPGGFRPGKELGSTISSTLVTASGGRRIFRLPPVPPTPEQNPL